MRSRVLGRALLGLAAISFTGTSAASVDTHIWLSNSSSLTAPEAPPTQPAEALAVNHLANGSGTLFIWAKPATGKVLANWSLRLVTPDHDRLAFTTSTVEPFNPVLGNSGGAMPKPLHRWEFVNEPVGQQNPPPIITNSIEDLQGFSLFGDDRIGLGIGALGAATANDTSYNAASEAWLLASVNYTVTSSLGVANVYLQIGETGLSYQDELSTLASVVFGATSDTALDGNDNRKQNSDTPDALITVVPPGPPADFTADGVVDGADFLVWQRGLGVMNLATKSMGDANSDGHVNGADLVLWKQGVGPAAGATGILVPEPASIALVAVLAPALCIASRRRRRARYFLMNRPKFLSREASRFAARLGVAATRLIALMAFAGGAASVRGQTNPYTPTGANIQSMLDRTGVFSNSQASTAVYSNIPGGKQLNITWSTGAPSVNETFTRIVTAQLFPENNGDGDGGDLAAFDGVTWRVLSDMPVTIKPFSQSWDNFNFQEGSQTSVPANTPTTVSINWNMVTGSFPASDRTNVHQIGFQIFGPSPPQNGTTARSTLAITSMLDPAHFIAGSLSETIVESRSGGQNFAWYSEDGGGFPNSWSDSGSKSTAAGVTPGIGSRFNSNAAIGGAGTWFQVAPTLPTAGGIYEVYATNGT